MPGERQQQATMRAFLTSGFCRLSLNGDVLIEVEKPVLKMGQAQVVPPPGCFVQAMSAAETQMAEMVVSHLQGCKQVADLFCGIGTFALRLAEHASVLAIETDQPSLDALAGAWRDTGGKLRTINTEKRDLFRRPLMANEMKKITGVVFDPPRAGAEAQARQLAKSKVAKIAAVSCNPTTLARDLQVLCDGGFRVKSVTPFDQFAFTPHVEVVVLLER